MRAPAAALRAARAWSQRHLHSTSSPEASSPHWLDAHFPRVRAALDAASHRAWLRSVHALLPRAAPQAALAGQQKLIVEAVEQQYARLLNTHSARVPRASGRAQAHVHAACRVAATYLALSPFCRDGEELLAQIKDQAGAAAAPVLRAAHTAALFFSLRPAALATAALRALRLDYGPEGFEFGDEKEDVMSLVVTKCLYADIFAAEGVPRLATCTCCSLDTAVWFGERPSALLRMLRPSAAAVRVRLESSLARGQHECCVRVITGDTG